MLARRLPGILPPLDADAALEVTRIHSVAGARGRRAAARLAAAVPRAAPQRLDRRHRRRRAAPPAGRGEPRASRRAAPRRARRVPAAGARGAAPAARGRLRHGLARRRPRRLPGPLPARRDDEPVPVRRPRRPCRRSARCSAQRLARYRDKLSRALLDRFDLVLAMPRVRGEELAAAPGESSAAVAARVATARERLAAKPPSRDSRGGCAAAPRRRPAPPVRTRAMRAWAGSRGRSPRSPGPSRCEPSTWPRRSPIARRTSSSNV